ncbi:protein of unknown function [Modestobacter italicus]|uniref:Uncharacterized protein n=1 Tax=Modestobacter italicus (strain DSM 44449 / CECT 9708 / BC 501) TaxID=2732864 RepID=I4EX82_MODI5|nr:protein of unknown function [Modestobacter marinus]
MGASVMLFPGPSTEGVHLVRVAEWQTR